MAQRSPVPKFGNWESADNVPYTVCFEKARKGRNRGKINTIESQQNSDSIQSSSLQLEPTGAQNEDHLSQEEIDLSRRSLDSPLQSDDAIGQSNGANVFRAKHGQRRLTDSPIIVVADSPVRHYGGVSSGYTNRRGMRLNGNSDVSIEQSPLHLSKFGSKSNGVSLGYSRERKGSSEGASGQSPMTPGRSRLRSAIRAADDSLDKGAAVPKFGEWDESNPASAEGYTLIFNKVKEERHGGPTKAASNLSTQTSNSSGQKHCRNERSKSIRCFCWA